MKTILNKSELKDISTIVFYKKAGIAEDPKADLVLYKSSNTRVNNSDFIEYGLSSLVEKYKYNDKDQLSFFDDYLIRLIDKNSEVAEKLNKCLFPTLSTESTKNIGYGYFGTLTIQSRTLYIFEVPEDICKVELYESVITTNNSDYDFIIDYDYLVGGIQEKYSENVAVEKINSLIQPGIVITLGPDLETNLDKDSFEFRKLEDEIYFKKTIYLTTSSEDNQFINLSYKLWNLDENSNRNKNKYSLRNDEYYSTINNINVIEKSKNSDLIYESGSNLLLSNKKVQNHPILNSKLNRVSNKILKPFSTKVVYNLGDKVEYNSESYTSLSNNNIGNIPVLSSHWILSERTKDFLTTRVNIYVNPLDSAIVSPNKSVSINSLGDTNMSFSITSNPGYIFEGSVTSGDRKLSNGYTSKDGIFSQCTIYSSEDWDVIKKTKSIVFNLTKINTKFTFRLKADRYYNLSDWGLYLDTESVNFGINGISVDGNTIAIPSINSDNKTIEFATNKDSVVRFTLGKLNKFSVNSIKASDVINGNVWDIDLKVDEDGNYYFEDIASFTEVSYILDISNRSYDIEVFGNLKYYEVEHKFFTSKYKDCINVRFYSCENNELDPPFSKILILSELNGYSTKNGKCAELKYDKLIKDPDISSLTSKQSNSKSVYLNGVYFTLFYNSNDGVYTLHSTGTNENYKIKILRSDDEEFRSDMSDWENYLSLSSNKLKIDDTLYGTEGFTALEDGWWYNPNTIDERAFVYKESEIYNVSLEEGNYIFRLRYELYDETVSNFLFGGASIQLSSSINGARLYSFDEKELGTSLEYHWITSAINVKDGIKLSFLVKSNPRFKYKWEYRKIN